MCAWITPPEDFQPDEAQEQTWKAVDTTQLLDPVLQFGREAPLRPNLRVLREKVQLPTDIDLLVVQYCRTLGEHVSSPENFDISVTDITFEDQAEGRLLHAFFPDTKGTNPVQSIAFRLDEDQLTTAIFTTEKSLVTPDNMLEMGQVLRTLQGPNQDTNQNTNQEEQKA